MGLTRGYEKISTCFRSEREIEGLLRFFLPRIWASRRRSSDSRWIGFPKASSRRKTNWWERCSSTELTTLTFGRVHSNLPQIACDETTFVPYSYVTSRRWKWNLNWKPLAKMNRSKKNFTFQQPCNAQRSISSFSNFVTTWVRVCHQSYRKSF